MLLQDLIQGGQPILTEGAVVERLRRSGALPLDPQIVHAGFVRSHEGREALAAIYRQYLDIASANGLPMLGFTATWRANPERLQQVGLPLGVNGESVRFLRQVQGEYPALAGKAFVGGLMGCRGDAYRPQEALPEAEAALFHRAQAQALADDSADFLFGSTLPALCEATGMARAMAETGAPYVISFMIDRAGRMLDGTPLADAIAQIDATVAPRPLFYSVNCCHPTFLEAAFESEAARPQRLHRLIAIQANTSSKSVEELDGLCHLDTEEPEVFAEAMLRLHRRHGVRVLGGCCGTDDRHIAAVARGLRASEG